MLPLISYLHSSFRNRLAIADEWHLHLLEPQFCANKFKNNVRYIELAWSKAWVTVCLTTLRWHLACGGWMWHAAIISLDASRRVVSEPPKCPAKGSGDPLLYSSMAGPCASSGPIRELRKADKNNLYFVAFHIDNLNCVTAFGVGSKNNQREDARSLAYQMPREESGARALS